MGSPGNTPTIGEMRALLAQALQVDPDSFNGFLILLYKPEGDIDLLGNHCCPVGAVQALTQAMAQFVPHLHDAITDPDHYASCHLRQTGPAGVHLTLVDPQ